jgi:2,4-dienoyl-CoA reductase (NADPH2)
VAVIGGGLVGCETADYLAAAGHKVTVIEMLPEVGQELGNHNRWVVMARLKKDGVTLLAETRADEIIPGAVRVSQKDTAVDVLADTVVLSAGFSPDHSLFRALEGRAANLHRLGACNGARRVKETVAEAFETAYRL